MFFYLLIIGLVLTLLLHFSLQELARFKHNNPERYRKIMATGGLLGVMWIVSRIGVATVTNFMWALAALLPFIRRPQARTRSSAMTKQEAARILRIDENATSEAIHAAWRAQMQRNHPDQGGSEYLASQINQAKDVLLKK